MEDGRGISHFYILIGGKGERDASFFVFSFGSNEYILYFCSVLSGFEEIRGSG